MEKNEKQRNIMEDLEKKFNEIKNIKNLNDLKVEYMGKKGVITLLQSELKNLSPEEKKPFGKMLNDIKVYFEDNYKSILKKFEMEELNDKLKNESIDINLPSTKLKVGNINPLIKIVEEVEDLFMSMGYDVEEGPEVESDLYNFELLNLPKSHPARDAQDSFYINNELLLRTQTSPVQVRTMLKNEKKDGIRIICPGKTYRRDDDDATHSHQFMQIEGLVVDKGISMKHLKGTLEEFAKRMFGENKRVRFRPSFFPFTEPSVEVDLTCFKCNGEGCSICKGTGWIEILGAGMVHPIVLKNCGYDPEIYTGFAFGVGVERIAMFKYEIPDIRNFYINDKRFLEQFNCIEGSSIKDESK